jgi:hypothetical protein
MKDLTMYRKCSRIQDCGRHSVLALFLLLFVGVGLAQVGPTSIPTAVNPVHAPMKLLGALPGGGVESENWSGYAVTGSDFTYAHGSWHVPQVDCTATPNTYSVFWVGIDGYSDNTVEQTGTASDCDGTTAVYYAWYEFFPANPVPLPMTVSPGDVMGAEVKYINGEFFISIHDHTTGVTNTATGVVPGALRTSAEFIAEAPKDESTGEILPLADFVRANYGQDYNADKNSCNATDSTEDNKPIADFGSDYHAITMVSSGGVTKATPTNLTPDGSSFRVYWNAE